MRNFEVLVHSDYIEYVKYPFGLSAVSKNPRIKPQDINFIMDRFPPELVLHSGEIIFFPRSQRKALQLFVAKNNVAVKKLDDIWACLGELALDAELSDEDKEKRLQRLVEMGIAGPELESIEKKFLDQLLSFNSFAWEWAGFSHMDILNSRMFLNKEFYEWTMRIAGKNHHRGMPDLEFQNPPTPQKILSDLKDWWTQLFMQSSRSGFSFFKMAYDVNKAMDKMKLADQKFSPVFNSYSESHRHFHNLFYLWQTLSQAVSLSPKSETDIMLAIWFQNIICDPKAQDNPERSSEFLSQWALETPFKKIQIETAQRLILMTKNSFQARKHREQVVFDSTMQTYALPSDLYQSAVENIRKESFNTNEFDFVTARRHLLQRLLDWQERQGRLFFLLDPIFEEQARNNISQELKKLTP